MTTKEVRSVVIIVGIFSRTVHPALLFLQLLICIIPAKDINTL